MIHVVFTLDYELYGDGSGSVQELVCEPASRLREVFRRWEARFVAFVEVAEFQKMETVAADQAMPLVAEQIRELYEEGFEIGLHLHPQWCNAKRENGTWKLDYSEYNLCVLPETRVAAIVDEGLGYLRRVTVRPDFTPLSFRAGNWLFQPTAIAAAVLGARGIRIDSSVFKGGVQHNHGLDYRSALKNPPFWRFGEDVNVANPQGRWLEVPIHSEMVPFWRMLTGKRVALQTRGTAARSSVKQRCNRLRDYLRPQYPLKLDYCRMTLPELTTMIDRLVDEGGRDDSVIHPVVAIGHTKDLVDIGTVDEFLGYLRSREISVSTFEDIYSHLWDSVN